MSTSKSEIVEKSSKHSVSPIRDVLLVPPGALQTKEENAESIHTHPALLVEERTSQNTSHSPSVTSTTNNNRTGIVAVAVKHSDKSSQSHKSKKEKAVSVSPKTKKEEKGRRKVKGKGREKRTRHAGGGNGTRKKYNRKLRTTRGKKR
jgi:hypothetical protein